jgi:prolipoprotein diacylglyceryltransferase
MMSDKVVKYITRNPDKFGLEGVTDIAAHIEENNLFVHPTFFYEFASCMVGFLVLYIILKKFRKFSGQLFLCYGIWYGTERTIVEGPRTDSLYIGNTDLRVSQVLSLIIVVVCLILLIVNLIRVKKNPKPIEGVDFFPEGSAKMLKEKRAEKEALKKQNKEGVDNG